MKRLAAGIVAGALAMACAVPASAAITTYDVNMNFDPTTQEGGPGVGTITGTFSIDTTTLALTNLDLTEATHTADTIGGGFGSPTFTSLDFDNSSITSAISGQQADAFGGLPFLFVRVQSTCCLLDGIEIGPNFQFDFPTAGGAVQPGNFDSTTSENRFLYGTVTLEAASGAPEPESWALMLAGFGLVGGALRARRVQRAGSALA
jgi:PEP-CTERM motif